MSITQMALSAVGGMLIPISIYGMRRKSTPTTTSDWRLPKCGTAAPDESMRCTQELGHLGWHRVGVKAWFGECWLEEQTALITHTSEAPPSEAPPSEAPPVETPPVEAPPVDEKPPVAKPPTKKPSARKPRAKKPPAEKPPAKTSAVEKSRRNEPRRPLTDAEKQLIKSCTTGNWRLGEAPWRQFESISRIARRG